MAAFVIALYQKGHEQCRTMRTIRVNSDNAAISHAKKWLTESRRSTRLIGLYFDAWSVEKVDKTGGATAISSGEWTLDDETREMELQAEIREGKAKRAKRATVNDRSIEGLGKRTPSRRKGGTNSTGVATRQSTPSRQSSYLRSRIEQMKEQAKAKLASG